MDLIIKCPSCGKEDIWLMEASLQVHAKLRSDVIDLGFSTDELDVEKSVVQCKNCFLKYPLSFLTEEYQEILGVVRKALLELNEGRELGCWPLGSFGWKDADLEPEGCTGIAGFIGERHDRLIIAVGGHKSFTRPSTFVDDEDMGGALDDSLADEIFVWNVDWDTEDVTVSYNSFIEIPVPKSGDDGYRKWAEAVVHLAKEEMEDFSSSMVKASALIDKMC